MYKINLFDEYTCDVMTEKSIYFVEDLEGVEQYWSKDPYIFEESKKEDWSSKPIQLLMDYLTNLEETEYVELDQDALILEEKDIILNNHRLLLHSICGVETCRPFEQEKKVEIYAEKIILKFAKIIFGNRYYVAAKYRMEGMCQKIHGEWNSVPYNLINNPVILGVNPSKAKDWHTDGWDILSKDIYGEDWLETFAWLQIGEADSEEDVLYSERYFRSQEVLDRLMNDIYVAME